jgi:transcriptional regulator GlxA family with amidase domain
VPTNPKGVRPVAAVEVAPRVVALATRFMLANLTERVPIARIAAACDVPERTLRRQFRRFTGRSPSPFIGT